MAPRRKQSITTGGGAGIMLSNGISVPEQPEDVFDRSKKTGSVMNVLSGGDEAYQNGREVVELVREAIELGATETGIRRLGDLVKEFPQVVLRVPEFHEFMNWLLARGFDGAIGRIMGDAVRRGRPRADHFELVAFVKQVRKVHACGAAAAARWIATKWGARFGMDARSIQNVYSQREREFEIWLSQTVDASDLTSAAWCRPR